MNLDELERERKNCSHPQSYRTPPDLKPDYVQSVLSFFFTLLAAGGLLFAFWLLLYVAFGGR